MPEQASRPQPGRVETAWADAATASPGRALHLLPKAATGGPGSCRAATACLSRASRLCTFFLSSSGEFSPAFCKAVLDGRR